MLEYHRTIIFTKTKLDSYFRFKDYFQIFPAELENMPKSKLQRHFPVILEYTTTEEDKIDRFTEFEELRDLASLTATTLTKQDQILSLLTVFTNHVFFRYTDLTGTWGIPIFNDNPGKEANTWSSKWNIISFHWPELPAQLKIKEFSKPCCSEITYIKHSEYYFINPNFDIDREASITFPVTINIALNTYYKLNSISKANISTAIDHMQSSIELMYQKKTLSLISAFTSIETMVNNEFKNEKPDSCKSCNQLQFKISQKFKDFLFRYVGKSIENKKKFNAFYSLRSKIIHTGEQLKTEKLWADLPQDKRDKEYLDQVEVIQLGRISIVQWLIRNSLKRHIT